MPRFACAFAFIALSALARCEVAVAETWKAGAAKIAITPDKPIWMSGYASRNRPAQGKVHDLWARALLLEDPSGQRLLFITLDLVGIDRGFSLATRAALRAKHGLDATHVALLSSHTHSGPVVGTNLRAMYFLDDEQHKLVDQYTNDLRDKIVRVAGDALARLAPADIAWGTGTAGFAVNRRNNQESEVPRLRAEGKLVGPQDHDVPVLAVRTTDGQLQAVLFGYACHATVLDGYDWCGDYPGFAQAYLEQSHPGAVALFFAGCGADQNPLPRRQLALADQYGKELADAVSKLLRSEMHPLAGPAAATYREIELPFAQLPSREQWLEAANSDNRYEASRAKLLLQRLELESSISATYPYPVQTWKLGDGPVLVTLGGEVVVDYALRLKRQLKAPALWVAGYANDVMAYIPSRRVLQEGGYEGGGAMVYYGQPAPWGASVEDLIVAEVERQALDLAK